MGVGVGSEGGRQGGRQAGRGRGAAAAVKEVGLAE